MHATFVTDPYNGRRLSRPAYLQGVSVMRLPASSENRSRRHHIDGTGTLGSEEHEAANIGTVEARGLTVEIF